MMDRGSKFRKIADKYGEEYIYRQLAEECSELSKACLKVIRAERKETPMRMDEAKEHLLEEIGDVVLMIDMIGYLFLSTEDICAIDDISARKEKRMYERLIEGKMEEHIW